MAQDCGVGDAVLAAEFTDTRASDVCQPDRLDLVLGEHCAMVADGHAGVPQALTDRLHMHAVTGSDLLLGGAVAIVDNDAEYEVIGWRSLRLGSSLPLG